MNIFLAFEDLLLKHFSYNFVVRFEDAITFLAGMFVGSIIMAYLCSRVIFKLQKVNNLGSNKVELVKFKYDGIKHYIADPKNVSEAMETILLIIFRPFFTDKEYDLRNQKRTVFLLTIISILGLTTIFLSVCSIINVVIS